MRSKTTKYGVAIVMALAFALTGCGSSDVNENELDLTEVQEILDSLEEEQPQNNAVATEPVEEETNDLKKYEGKWYFHATPHDAELGMGNVSVDGSTMYLSVDRIEDIDISPIKTITFSSPTEGKSEETFTFGPYELRGIFKLEDDCTGTESITVQFVLEDGTSPLECMYMYRQSDRTDIDCPFNS